MSIDLFDRLRSSKVIHGDGIILILHLVGLEVCLCLSTAASFESELLADGSPSVVEAAKTLTTLQWGFDSGAEIYAISIKRLI